MPEPHDASISVATAVLFGSRTIQLTSNRKNWLTFVSAMLLTGSIAATWLNSAGLNDESLRIVIRHSGQTAFLIYLVIVVARPLQQLLHTPATAKLLRNRHLIGVAFAGLMTAHLFMIILHVRQSPDFQVPLSTVLIGGGAYTLIYLMFITSFDKPAQVLGKKAWKILHRTGLLWLGFTFAAPRSLADFSDPDYLKFGIPALLAIFIRLAAWQQSNQPDSRR